MTRRLLASLLALALFGASMPIAPLVAAYGRRWPRQGQGPIGMPNGVPPVTFGQPGVMLGVKVVMFLGGEWTDVTALGYVLYRDAVIVQRGIGAEGGFSRSSRGTFTLKNEDGNLSPRNPAGIYFGKLGLNIQVKIYVNPGSGDLLRITGRVTDWSPKIGSDNERTVGVTVSGVIQQISQGERPARSSARRFLELGPTLGDFTAPLAAWTMEDTGVASGGTALYGAADLRPFVGIHPSGAVVTYPQWGKGTLAPWLPPVLNAANANGLSIVWAPVSMSPSVIAWTMDLAYAGTTDSPGTVVDFNPSYLGGAAGWPQLIFSPVGNEMQITLDGGPEISIATAGLYDGLAHHVRLTAFQSGADTGWQVSVDAVIMNTGTYAGLTLPVVRTFGLVTDGGSGAAAIGYVAVYGDVESSLPDASDSIRGHQPASGFAGETPSTRFLRICREEGIECVVDELVVDSQIMGTQGVGTPLQLLEQCAEVAEGVLDETMENKLRLTSRTARWNQAPMIVIDYDLHAVGNSSAGLDPSDDDRFVRNKWTITRQDTSFSTTVEKTTGSLNSNQREDDPQGVGLWPDSGTLSLSDDIDTLGHAAWRTAKGTVDQLRFRGLPVLLHNPRSAGLIELWTSRDPVGGRLWLANAPADFGGGTLDQMIDGYVERFDQFEWLIIPNTSPNDINAVGTLDNPVGDFLDSDGTTTNELLDTTETGINLAIADNCVWAHDVDFDIVIDSERMTCTGVFAATGGPYPATQFQTITVVRSVNGVVQTHDFGVPVHPFNPFILAL